MYCSGAGVGVGEHSNQTRHPKSQSQPDPSFPEPLVAVAVVLAVVVDPIGFVERELQQQDLVLVPKIAIRYLAWRSWAE